MALAAERSSLTMEEMEKKILTYDALTNLTEKRTEK